MDYCSVVEDKGMLEDMMVGVAELKSVSFQVILEDISVFLIKKFHSSQKLVALINIVIVIIIVIIIVIVIIIIIVIVILFFLKQLAAISGNSEMDFRITGNRYPLLLSLCITCTYY